MTTIKCSSTSHVALLYAKMKKAPITADDLIAFAPRKFRAREDVNKTIRRLAERGLISRSNAGWVLTKEGMNQIIVTAKPYRGENAPR